MVDQELDELRREFLAESAAKVREMEASVDGGRSPQAAERLTYLAHQLKGSGGSYGFERISADWNQQQPVLRITRLVTQ